LNPRRGGKYFDLNKILGDIVVKNGIKILSFEHFDLLVFYRCLCLHLQYNSTLLNFLRIEVAFLLGSKMLAPLDKFSGASNYFKQTSMVHISHFTRVFPNITDFPQTSFTKPV